MQQAIIHLQTEIAELLATTGANTPYAADANEPDPRYQGYGVRAPQMKQIIKSLNPVLRDLSTPDRVALIQRLIDSGFGEQKTIAIHLMELTADFFTAEHLDLVDTWVRGLHGWSKVDTITARFLPTLLRTCPDEVLALSAAWNKDPDLWLRRTSVVLYTRNIAKSGAYTDVALERCTELKYDSEALVQKGVGWCLKDHLKDSVPADSRRRTMEFVNGLVHDNVPRLVIRYALQDFSAAQRKKILQG